MKCPGVPTRDSKTLAERPWSYTGVLARAGPGMLDLAYSHAYDKSQQEMSEG
jgi:hypothetical protein